MMVGEIRPVSPQGGNYLSDFSIKNGDHLPHVELDSDCVADPKRGGGRLREWASRLGNTHLFEHQCSDNNCKLEGLVMKPRSMAKSPFYVKFSALRFIGVKEELVDGQDVELTYDYGRKYVQTWGGWQSSRRGIKIEELQPCECKTCKTQNSKGDEKRYMIKNHWDGNGSGGGAEAGEAGGAGGGAEAGGAGGGAEAGGAGGDSDNAIIIDDLYCTNDQSSHLLADIFEHLQLRLSVLEDDAVFNTERGVALMQ